MDDLDNPLPPGHVGRLAVKGPTGCRYLADERQKEYVRNGWNYTGDAYLVDDDGYFFYQARTDDMIISSGYNIASPEVESALLMHPQIAECGVIGVPDEERGQVVKAFVVVREGVSETPELVTELQDFVKRTIAPYKYPRAIEFLQVVAAHRDRQTAAVQATAGLVSDRAMERRASPNRFEQDMLVRFSHCDPAGIVFYPEYFILFNALVEDWFNEALGIDYAQFISERRVGLPTLKITCEFLRPSRIGERLAMGLSVAKVVNRSFVLAIDCRFKDEERVRAEQIIVTTSLDTHRSIFIPSDLRTKIDEFRGQTNQGVQR